ncbi:MAG: hypothetical protein L0H74_12255 [Brachybacterium sp.]|nr:hypothetical protein [Brachybacterium sp.]MDN5900829.1 hypothetical protein [Brachybacterium sp.]
MTTDRPDRLPMTREQALAWNPAWSAADIRLLEENVDRLDARTFYRTRSNGSVTAQDADGLSVMYLSPGYVEFRKGLAPTDRPDPAWHGLALSCFRPRSTNEAGREEGPAICPSCFLALPATGVCDDCG